MPRQMTALVVTVAALTTCSFLCSNAKTDAAATERPDTNRSIVNIDEKQPADGVKCACILFDGNKGHQTVFEGRIPQAQFVKWFKEDYRVGGERVETPPDATVIGALVLTDGEEILVMPMHSWSIRGFTSFACQSIAIGKAPMFSVLEESKKQFLATMKARLRKLSKPTT